MHGILPVHAFLRDACEKLCDGQKCTGTVKDQPITQEIQAISR